ncbi:MAG: cytochrome P450 [Rhodobacterales bacterium]|jgi:cytochrome P450|tara:strand:- start:461 stop:1693 length:1233 start_codon:yes stop_codon:yes gene_type:complete
MKDDGHLNLLDHDSFTHGVPHNTFARLREEDPVNWTEGDSETKGFWSLTRHADILMANKENKIFSSAQGIRLEDQSYEEYMARRTFQETDAPEHTDTRRKVNPNFAKPIVSKFEPLIRELASDIADKALQKSEFDAVDAIAKQLPMMMLGRILGVPDEDLDWLVEKGDALIGNSDPDFTEHVVDKMDTSNYRMMPFRSPAGLELYEYAEDLLSNRRSVAEEGILAKMMQSENGLDELGFKNFFCLLVAAGNDTTRYSIAMALNLLANDPSLIAQLKTGQYWDTCADEFVRLASPTMHFRRTATQDYDLHGKTIREGDKVLLWFVSGSRDERVFERPQDTILGRSPNRHLAFGQGGIHVCLGMHLAKLEVRIAIEELVKRIERFEAVSPPTWTRSNFICGVKQLNVRAKVS